MAVNLRLLTDAFTAHLVSSGLNATVGNAPNPATKPYVVIFPLPSNSRDGNLTHPYQAEAVMYQTSCWSDTAKGALWTADKVREALEDPITPPSGWRIMHIRPEVSGGLFRDDSTGDAALYQVALRWSLWMTPNS